ncbi:MAG: rRNA adenine N-6-methyltransferase family protein [Phycisphaeraceae bacterium]
MPHGLTFLWQFLRHPTKVGAVWPSSKRLARAMTDSINWKTADVVLEYGPGTGIFTEQIVQAKQPATRFLAIELNPSLASILQQKLNNVEVVVDSVANVVDICKSRDIEKVCGILCGLPWASFPESLQRDILDAMFHVLKPGGQFATFAYRQGVWLPAGRRFRRMLDERFGKVECSPTVWRNMPPAFVYRCTR